MTNRGKTEYFEGSAKAGSDYLLLGSDEEGGILVVIDDARTFHEAKEKSDLFLEDHPSGGIIIVKQMCACYRLPIYGRKDN